MPKDYIVLNDDRRRVDREGGPLPAIRVGWSREDGHVQIATVIMAGTDGALSEVQATVDQGQFIDMDRRTINDTIRALRKARDAAFGADA